MARYPRSTAADLAAAEEQLGIARSVARYLISVTGAPARTVTKADADTLDADGLAQLAARYDGHPLARQIAARLDNADALLGVAS